VFMNPLIKCFAQGFARVFNKPATKLKFDIVYKAEWNYDSFFGIFP
jgi:hypothetical protein